MVGVVWAAGRRQAMPSLLDPPARDCVCQTLSSSLPGLSLHGAPLASESSIASRSRDGDSVGRCCCSSLCDFPCMVASWLQCFWDDAVRPCRRRAQETSAELALSLSAICLIRFSSIGVAFECTADKMTSNAEKMTKSLPSVPVWCKYNPMPPGQCGI